VLTGAIVDVQIMALFALMVRDKDGAWKEIARLNASTYTEAIQKAETLLPRDYGDQPIGLRVIDSDSEQDARAPDELSD